MHWRLICKNLENSNEHLQIDFYRLIKYGLKTNYMLIGAEEGTFLAQKPHIHSNSHNYYISGYCFKR